MGKREKNPCSVALKMTEMDNPIYSDFITNDSDKRLRNLTIKIFELYPPFHHEK